MILTSHALIGAAIANTFPTEPLLGLTLSFVSHYMVDILPHTNYANDNLKKKFKNIFQEIESYKELFFAIIDVVMAVLLVYIIFVRDRDTLILSIAGAFVGVLPDILNFIFQKYSVRYLHIFDKAHNTLHYSKDYNHGYIHGVVTQFIAVLVFVAIYFLSSVIYI